MNIIFNGGIDSTSGTGVSGSSYLSNTELGTIRDRSDHDDADYVVAPQSSTLAYRFTITSGNVKPDVINAIGNATTKFSNI